LSVKVKYVILFIAVVMVSYLRKVSFLVELRIPYSGSIYYCFFRERSNFQAPKCVYPLTNYWPG